MNNERQICRLEPEIVNAIQSGIISPALGEHLESCPDCRAAARIVRFFKAGEAAEERTPRIPSPGLIRWKSNLRKKQAAAEKIARPMLAAHIFALFILAAIIFTIILLRPPLILALGSTIAGVFDTLGPIIIPVLLGIFVFGLLSTMLLYLSNKYFLADK